MTMKTRAKARPTPAEETASALLQRAVALHRDGKLAEAAELYEEILRTLPQQK